MIEKYSADNLDFELEGLDLRVWRNGERQADHMLGMERVEGTTYYVFDPVLNSEWWKTSAGPLKWSPAVVIRWAAAVYRHWELWQETEQIQAELEATRHIFHEAIAALEQVKSERDEAMRAWEIMASESFQRILQKKDMTWEAWVDGKTIGTGDTPMRAVLNVGVWTATASGTTNQTPDPGGLELDYNGRDKCQK